MNVKHTHSFLKVMHHMKVKHLNEIIIVSRKLKEAVHFQPVHVQEKLILDTMC